MMVVELFVEEHSLFRALLDKLEFDLAQRADRARADVVDALRALMPSLDQHEEIEDIVFRHPPDGIGGERQALAEIATQHHELSALREEILFALERNSEEYPFVKLRMLAESLIKHLRAHLESEEVRLWPLYQEALRRPLEAVVPIHLEKRAQALERELGIGIAAISHSASVDPEKP
jgi:hemerythrin-like domain-containing protein